MVPTRDIGTRYNGLATVPKFSLHVPASDEAKEDVRKMLNQVKHLYFDRRYRQCASKCLELLENHTHDHHPLIRTFLYFYAALAYDTLARSMHNHSVARIPSLQQSEDFYNKALATLPEPLPLQQDENRPPSPPKLALSLPVQDDQLNGRPSIPSMWDLNSTFDAFDLSSSPSRRRSFSSSKGHSRTDSLVTDVSWTGNLDCDPFTDDHKHDQHKTENNNFLSVGQSSVKRPSPLHLRKARSSDSLLSENSGHETDSPAQTPSRKSKNDYYDDNGLNYQYHGPPPATPPPQTQGFVDMVEGTPIQWATPSTQHDHSDYNDDKDENNDPATPTPARVRKPTNTTTATETPAIQRTHPCPRLLFPRDLSSSSFGLLPLPLNARIQHYNGDLSAFRAQLVSHLLAIQSLKNGGSSSSTPGSSRSVSSSSTWSEATATDSGGAAEENRRRSAVMSPTAAETANASGGRAMTPGEKADRIAEGRKRGWARERFDPAYCRELARLALQECEV